MKVKVAISNRHVHLTKETFEHLFGKSTLEKRNDLNQVGEFAALETVDLVYKDKIIPHVRIVGPFRKDNQIELLGTDLEYFGIEPFVRRSGILDGTPGITIKNENKEITLDHGVIRAERHVHIPSSMEEELNLHERDKVIIKTPNREFDANVKVSDNGYYELHIDRDEALEYGLQTGEEVEIVKCGK